MIKKIAVMRIEVTNDEGVFIAVGISTYMVG